MWLCKCDCGSSVTVIGADIRSGHTKSCGCFSRERLKVINKTHGLSKTPEYKIFDAMKRRCYKDTCEEYNNYGARGIGICDRWRYSFENFYADMGPRPSKKHSIERGDNNLGYGPENCYWGTGFEQANNTIKNIYFELDGVRLSQRQWERRWGIKYGTIYSRLRKGDTFANLYRKNEQRFLSHSFGHII